MKIVKYGVGTVVVLALVFVGVSFVLPSSTHVERSIEISASQDLVFKLVSEHREFQKWSPWFKRDPEMKLTFEGPEVGIGAKSIWDSEDPNVGKGSSEYVEYEPPSRAAIQLDFGDMGTAKGYFDLAQSGEKVRVTWGFDTENKGIMQRYFGLMLDKWVGADYEEGLGYLKELAEALPK